MIESSAPAMKGEKTKYRLAAAMKECMKTTPVDAITVRQITERCGVTRQTFYRNFLDKYDLINWYFDKLLARSFEHMGRGTTVLDSLEKKIADTAHRPDKVAAFLGKNVSDKVVPEDLVKIASSVNGLRKDAENRDYRVYLNKVDVLEKPEVAETICRKLKEREIFAVYGSIRHEIKRTVR